MTKKIQKKRKLFRVSEKGYVTGIVAILLPILIVIVGFGVDWNYSNISKSKYSTFGMEILSIHNEPIYKGTPDEKVIEILKKGYDLAGMEYDDVKITPHTNGSEFKVEVKFKSNSLFSNISSGTWTSMFTYPYTDVPVPQMGDRPFYIDVALRTNARAFQESFSYYVSTMTGFQSWANAKFELVNNIGATPSNSIEYHDVRVTNGRDVEVFQFPMWKFQSNNVAQNWEFYTSIGFFQIGRSNGIGQWFACNTTNIMNHYNLPNLAIPAKVYLPTGGANYIGFDISRTDRNEACARQKFRPEVVKFEFPRNIAVQPGFLKDSQKLRSSDNSEHGIEVIVDNVQFQDGGPKSSFTGSKFESNQFRSIWSKFTVKGTQFAYQNVYNIDWALWGLLKGESFDQTRLLSFDFVTTGLKVTLMSSSYDSDRYGTRIAMDQWNKFYLVNGILRPEYSGYALGYIDSLHLTRAQLFM